MLYCICNDGVNMENIQVPLNQQQANLVLRALEMLDEELDALDARGDTDYTDDNREVSHQLWNTIMNLGLDAGFGG